VRSTTTQPVGRTPRKFLTSYRYRYNRLVTLRPVPVQLVQASDRCRYRLRPLEAVANGARLSWPVVPALGWRTPIVDSAPVVERV
jgi:hypothetical protein